METNIDFSAEEKEEVVSIRCGCRGCAVARTEGASDLAQRIRELHKPQAPGLEGTFCQECYGDNDFGVWGHWPCETIKVLDGE